jgi:hypothetical protein
MNSKWSWCNGKEASPAKQTDVDGRRSLGILASFRDLLFG